MNMATELTPPDRPNRQQRPQSVRLKKSDNRLKLDATNDLLTQWSNVKPEQLLSVDPDQAKSFFMHLGYCLGQRDAEQAKQQSERSPLEQFRTGYTLNALRKVIQFEELRLEINPQSQNFYALLKLSGAEENNIFTLAGPVCWTLMGHANRFASALLGQEIIFKEKLSRDHQHCLLEGRSAGQWQEATTYHNYFRPTTLFNTPYPVQTPATQVNQAQLADTLSLGQFIGISDGFKQVCKLANKAATGKVSVLLFGETGVGKELVAKAIHDNSPRAKQAFVAVNCAAIPADLIEAELFGVNKGAYTGAIQSREGRFERANHGTIFLDEVIELSSRAQATLLRALQEGEIERVGDTQTRRVDVRVIAATNESLLQAVETGRFRADLYYRLNVYPIDIPPLRHRRDDIPVLTKHFVKKYTESYDKKTQGLTELARQALYNHSWLGNVRELENVIERGLILTENNENIEAHSLFPHLANTSNQQPKTEQVSTSLNMMPVSSAQSNEPTTTSWMELALQQNGSMELIEKNLLQYTLIKANHNVAEAARILNMTRPTLAYRLKKLNIETT